MPPARTLVVPVDARGIDEAKAGDTVQVAVQLKDGSIHAETIKLNAKKQAKASFKLKDASGGARVAVGPANATPEQLMGLQTINVEVTGRQWAKPELTLEPVLILPRYWLWWRRWCREVTVTGRIVCPDGSPVPGAEVTAYDVDWWWWWCSRQQVGTATTDHTGAFEITFRHCCYWWPWWWWRLRHWHLEPRLAEQLLPVLREHLNLERLPKPSPRPDLGLFDELLSPEGPRFDHAAGRPLLAAPSDTRAAVAGLRKEGRTPGGSTGIDLGRMERVRLELAERLPRIPVLERLRLWPWYPWYPWNDCSPDIIFRATQKCGGETKVIIDEGCFDTRWNVGSSLDVTLVAPDACCIPNPCPDPQDCPEGNCVVLSRVCSIVVDQIGGNPGALPAPEGYYGPTPPAGPAGADKPFGGNVPISGQFGSLTNVDYYEFELSDDGGATWGPMPPAASGAFSRVYWGPQVGTADPPDFHSVTFAPQMISGQNVYESREHFEANNDPASWSGAGQTRFWVSAWDRLTVLRTANVLADGLYDLRVRVWQEAGGNLQGGDILHLCNTDLDNGLVIRLDNRVVGPASGHPPTSPTHPTGAGTVHLQTLEPDTDIVGVWVDDVEVDPCDIIDADSAGTLRIRFLAEDQDQHLAWYTLRATWGENGVRNLLSQPSSSVTALGGAIEGPTYAAAVANGAVPPAWAGGLYELEMDVADAFPVSCAYKLELTAAKRTIVSCNANDPHRNWSHYSFTVQV